MTQQPRNAKTDNDTGFGALASNQGDRLVNRDGSVNVIRTGLPWFRRPNYFHALITMRAWKFMLIVLLIYFGLNVIFTCIYWLCGVEHLNGIDSSTPQERLLETFFFSCQTFTTLGYGRINPTGVITNIVSSVESVVGIMSFAILTGLFYGRFARPVVRLTHSEQALISPYKDFTALMFRIANTRMNQLIECEAQLMMSYKDMEGGVNKRNYIQIPLERSKINSLALSWTIVHPINEESPLYGWTRESMAEHDAEFIFLFKAVDETYSQTVYSRISYLYNEIFWGGVFVPMFSRSPDGTATLLQLDRIGEFEVRRM